MTSRASALSVLASLALASVAAAFGPVIPSPVMPAGAVAGKGLDVVLPRGVTHLQLDRNLVEALPKDGSFTLVGFPLSDGRFVDLELEAFDPIAPDAQILVGTEGPDGSWIQAPGDHRPDVRNFRGTIAGQPDSVAFLSFAPTSNVGMFTTEADETFTMNDGTLEGAGPLVIANMRELPEDAIEWAPFQCGTPLPPADPPVQSMQDAGMPRGGCKLFKLALDTDFEFHDRFPGSPSKTTNALIYISQQMGALASVYYNQLNVDATLQFLRLWKTRPTTGYPYRADYASVGMGRFLNDVKTRWTTNTSDLAVTRDLVIALSGQSLGGGVANGFGVVCSNTQGYCVAGSLYLSFPYPLQNKNPQNWDCVVFMHEIGHCFGAYHPHDTGDDDCFKPDYSGVGACTLKAQGTIMSYCHICSGGLANINLRFSTRNKSSEQIGGDLPTFACMANCTTTNTSTLTASSCASGGVDLSWTVVAGNRGYRIYRDDGVTVPVPMIQETAQNATSYRDTAVVSGASYTYFIRALLQRTDAANGNTIVEGPPSNDARGGTSLPTPTNVTTSRNPATGAVTVNWSLVTGATTYQVYRAIADGAETQIGTDVATNTFTDSTIPANRLASYRVTAGAAGCESPKSAPVFGGVGVIDLAATVGSTATGVELTWTAVDGATEYKVFRLNGNNTAGTPSVLVALPNPTTNSLLDTTAVPGRFYTYAVRAVIGGVDSDLGNRSAGWRNAAAPTGLIATDGTVDDAVNLSWTAPAGDISNYEVTRAVGAGPASVLTNSGSPLTGTTFRDTLAVPNITYTYRVRARTNAGVATNTFSAPSDPNDGWRGLGPPPAVAASDGLYTNMVTVSFVEVPGIAVYKVFRALATEPDGAMVQIGTTNMPPFRDTTCDAGVLYKYGVKSNSAAGDTSMSPRDNGYRSLGAPSIVNASKGTFTDRVEISWPAVPGATGYRLFRAGPGEPAGAPLATQPGTSFTDTTGTAGVLFAYTVICDSPAGPGRVSNTGGGWRNVPPPTNVLATDGTFTDRVRITWTPDVSTPRYAIYRRIGLQSPLRIAMVNGSSFDDRTARPGQLYSYTVRSVVTPGESAGSLPDSGFRRNPNGPNPDSPGGGGSGMIATDAGGLRAAPSSALAGPADRGGGDDEAPIDAEPLDDPLMRRVNATDPAWQLDCSLAGAIEMAAAVEAGSLDADGDRQPDLCERERGDLDLNGQVDAGDIVLMLMLVGEDDPVMGDFDHDGCVDRSDLEHLEDLVATQAELDALERTAPPTDLPTPQ